MHAACSNQRPCRHSRCANNDQATFCNRLDSKLGPRVVMANRKQPFAVGNERENLRLHGSDALADWIDKPSATGHKCPLISDDPPKDLAQRGRRPQDLPRYCEQRVAVLVYPHYVALDTLRYHRLNEYRSYSYLTLPGSLWNRPPRQYFFISTRLQHCSSTAIF